MVSDTIASVLKGHEVPAEIVVIDQSTKPHPTLQTMKPHGDCNIRYVWSHSVGLSRGRNEGLAVAQYEWIAFLDDDMYIDLGWFGIFIRTLIEAGPRAVVSGQVRPTESKIAGGFAPSTIEDPTPAIYQGRVMADVLYPGSMALHCSAINEVGLFDERLGAGSNFPAAEDNDMGYRLLKAGYRILYVPEAIVYQRAWRTNRDYMALRWDYGRGQGAFFAKHLSLGDGFMFRRMVNSYRRYIGRVLRYSLVRSRLQTTGDVMYVLGMFTGSVKWLLTQKQSN
jgi:GT2 family glycosyltransferase